MTTFVPRQSYSQEELAKLYPKELQLQLVQVVRQNVFRLGHKYLPGDTDNSDSFFDMVSLESPSRHHRN